MLIMKRSLKLQTSLGLAMGAVGAAVVAGFLILKPFAPEGRIKTALATHFPNSRITSVNCDSPLKGLCEVVIGPNLFYASHDASKIVVGSVLDLKARKDLTDQRLKELAAVEATAGRIGATQPATQVVAKPGKGKIEITLPITNAVVHNPGAPVKVSVFSDYSCGYCHQLFADLAGKTGIEVREYPIAILGAQSAEKAKLVLCSADRVKASAAAYEGGELKVSRDCAAFKPLVDENTAFASAHGISGTPAIIRSDGVVNAGYLPFSELSTFLGMK